jgi:hypothetical protein
MTGWRNPEVIEAQVRALMAQRAALPNVYPHRKERFELLVSIERGIDDWLLASAVGAA